MKKFLKNPEAHVTEWEKKIKKRNRDKDYNPFSSHMDSPVYEVINPENIQENLADVKGIEECLTEIHEIINFLKHPDKFIEKGAKIPKGVMLHGDPGVGKTMIARAIAKEAKVNFLY